MKKTIFAKLKTEAGEKLTKTPWDTYPRPKLKRDGYIILNGEWDFGVSEFNLDFGNLTKEQENRIFTKKILVPFSPESILSGIDEVYDEKFYRIYRRGITLPKGFKKDRVFIHFGGVDQIAVVYFNGKLLKTHVGGYSPFSVDVTDYLSEENTLIVAVKDILSNKVLPYGKQTNKRGGMWYTPVSGIWQTVWLETLPKDYIKSVKAEYKDCYLEVIAEGVEEGEVVVNTPKGEFRFNLINGKAKVVFNTLKFWSPENPYLYYFTVKTESDKIESYFAIRKLEIKYVKGIKRLCLNGKQYFFNGLLDQGYWSDGLFTPADAKCFTEEIIRLKALGFNTIRKHIKVEPELFYYDCDRLGMIVMQDAVNNGDYAFIRDTVIPTFITKKKDDEKIHIDKWTRESFIDGMKQMVEDLRFHPSICYWTIFNEGWGQFEGSKVYNILKELDDTRIIDTASGWFKGVESDVESEHVYFKRVKPIKTEKPLVVSEFGGKVYEVTKHVFNLSKSYGYGKCKSREEFVKRIRGTYLNEILPAIKEGLCGAVYTQVSDVEDEINGIFTYDRRVQKLLPEEFKDVSELMYKEIEK